MDNTQPSTAKRDWAGLILFVVVLGWLTLVSLGAHWIGWIGEQFAIIAGRDWPGWAWPLIACGQFVLLALPLLPLAWFWRGPRYRAVFQSWALAAVYVLTTLPARLAPPNGAALAASLQIAGTALYLAFLAALIWLRRRRGGPGYVAPRGSRLLAVALAPTLLCGWLAWGALGSASDILLNLASAGLFGLAVGGIVGHYLLAPLDQTSAGPGWDITLGGFAAGGCLVIMGSALGFNGLQLLLMLVLPVLGRTLVALTWFERGAQEGGEGRWLTVSLLVALVAAGPMLLVDPDELALVLNLETRDVLTWAFYATGVGMAATWVIGVVLTLLQYWLRRSRLGHDAPRPRMGRDAARPRIGWDAARPRIGRDAPRPRSRALLAGGATLTWLVAIALYLILGQPGLHGDRLYVVLKDQADLSQAPGIADPLARRQQVYQTLVAHANDTQAPIRRTLDRLGVDYTPYYLVNAMEVEGGPLVRAWLSRRSEVDRVLHSPVLRPLPAPLPVASGGASAPADPQWNLTSIGADRVWSEFGVTGVGVVVGQSDSGVQWDHPELRETYRGRDGKNDYDWLDPWYGTREPTDIGGHGTHTLGSIVGQTVGVAPGAEWYGCVNLARNLANPALYLGCMQFMLAPFPLDGDPFADGDPALGAQVINNSWGCPELEGCDPNALLDAVRALRTAGVFVVASAGNEGPWCGSVGDPLALYDDAFSVGAVDRRGAIALFSSRGPVTVDGEGRPKPDIVAPGVSVLSAYPGGTYSIADGTSMAGPHVVGVVALMWSANPALVGEVETTERILIETARPYDYALHGMPDCAGDGSYPNNAVGYGLVDAYAAVQQAITEGR